MTHLYHLQILFQMIYTKSQRWNVETESPLTICIWTTKPTPPCTPRLSLKPLLSNQLPHQKSIKNSNVKFLRPFGRTPERQRGDNSESTAHSSAEHPCDPLVPCTLSLFSPAAQALEPPCPPATTPSTQNSTSAHPFPSVSGELLRAPQPVPPCPGERHGATDPHPAVLDKNYRERCPC